MRWDVRGMGKRLTGKVGLDVEEVDGVDAGGAGC